MQARTTLQPPYTLIMPQNEGVGLPWGSWDPLARQEMGACTPLHPGLHMNTPVSRKDENETPKVFVFVEVLRSSHSCSLVRHFSRNHENTVLSFQRDLMICGEISCNCTIPSSTVAT